MLQRDVTPRALARELRLRGVHQWIYLGEDSAWRVQAESTLRSGAPRVSIVDLLDEMSWKLRQPYIDWIGELSRLNHSLDWWASPLAAKNVYGRFYLEICLLGVARQLIIAGFDRPTLIVISNSAVFDEVVRFARSRGVALRQLRSATTVASLCTIGTVGRRYLGGPYRRLRRVAYQLYGKDQRYLESYPAYRRRLLVNKGVTVGAAFAGEDAILLFSWIDQRSFTTEGGYRDPHLGPLPEMLGKRGYRVAYVARVLHTIPFEEAVDRLLQTGERLFFPELYISDQDRKNCRRRAWRFDPVVPPDLMVGGIPVDRLAREHVQGNRDALVEALVYECLVANLAADGVHPRQIIHTLEGFGWEQVLAWSVRRHMPNTKVIGYENGYFTRMGLSMYPARCEYGLRPLPDRIVTNGPLYRQILLSENIPSSLVEVGCGLRHACLSDPPPTRTGRVGISRDTKVRVLVATPIGFADTVELVSKAVYAFGGDVDYEVVVKCHPTLDEKQVMSHLGALIQRDNLRFATTAVIDLLSSTDLLLYTHTLVCYEALWYAVPPVFVRAENFLNLDELEATPDVRWEATTPEDLRRVAEEITRMTPEERHKWQKRAAEIVRLALAPITPESVDAFLL